MIRTEKDSVRIRMKKLDVALLLSNQEENVHKHPRKWRSKSSIKRMIRVARNARLKLENKIELEQLIAEKRAIACDCTLQTVVCEYSWRWFNCLSGCSIHPPRIVEDFANDTYTPLKECGLDESQIARIWLRE